MTGKRDNWTIFIIVLVATVATLVCGQLLWQKFAVAKPLDKGLQEIQGVEAATWGDNNKNTDCVIMDVSLGQVANLQKTYGGITDTAKRILGRKPFRVVLHDHRTPELESLYYTVHYQIQEAIVTGNFVVLAERIEEKAAAAKVDAKVYVDTKNVYVQLTKGTDAFYAVIPRQPDNQEVK